jgi:lipopolysaccharide heptosyltransferase I
VRILIVKLSAIGDVVHALPALELVRAALPDATLGWAVEAEAAPLLRGHPALDALHVIDRRALGRGRGRSEALRTALASLAALRAARWDAAIDLQGLARSALVARLAAPRVLGPASARELAPLAYTDRLDVPAPGEAHAVERYLGAVRAALEQLGVVAPERAPRPRLAIDDDDRARADRALAERSIDGELVVLLPGAGKPANRPPTALLARAADEVLAARPRARAIVLGGPSDRDRADRVLARMSSRARAASLAGALDLRASAALLARAAVAIGGDTGPLHLARLSGTPVVALFFAAEPARTGPAGVPSSAPFALVRGDAPCAPCLARTCRREDRRRICLRPITPDAVARAALGLIARAAPVA